MKRILTAITLAIAAATACAQTPQPAPGQTPLPDTMTGGAGIPHTAAQCRELIETLKTTTRTLRRIMDTPGTILTAFTKPTRAADAANDKAHGRLRAACGDAAVDVANAELRQEAAIAALKD